MARKGKNSGNNTNPPTKKGSGGDGGKSRKGGAGAHGSHSKANSSKNRSTSFPCSKGNVPDRYAVKDPNQDVFVYTDYNHPSLDINNKKLSNQFRCPKTSSRGSHNMVKEIVSVKSQLISTAVVQEPVVKELKKGFDLDTARKPWCCFGTKGWNARRFAHRFSTNFSSPSICANAERLAGSVDFITDWNNFKTLFKAHGSNSHLSYLFHRIGNSVTIDHLDLTNVLLFPQFNQLPNEFVLFVKDIIREDEKQIKAEGRSNKSVMDKEAYHKILHANMKRPIKVDFSDSNRKTSETSSDPQFLHHVLFSTEKYNILAGSDIPVFFSESDEGTQTVFSNAGPNLSSLDAFDLWLDNKLMKCSKSLVSHHKDWKITGTQWLRTDHLPSICKFDVVNLIEHGEKLLQFLKEKVKSDCSYWLYRAPGSHEMTLYNLTNISFKDKKDDLSSTSATPLFDDWHLLKPYLPYFGTASLLKYSEKFCEAVAEKLCTKKAYELPDAVTVIEQAVSASNNAVKKTETQAAENCPNITVKAQKTHDKLELQAQKLLKYVKPEPNGWVIYSTDEISSQNFSMIVNCVKGIYTTAIALTPNLQNSIYRDAVERYFKLCLKLISSIGLTAGHLMLWDVDERKRQFITSYSKGVCNILVPLLDWFEQVDGFDSLDDPRHNEWMYYGYSMNVLYADTLGRITNKIYDKMRVRMPADIKLPSSENHEKVLELYLKAIELVPKEKSYEKDLDEANTKAAVAFLNAAHFHLTFPSLLHNVVGQPNQKQTKKNHPKDNGATTLCTKENGDIDPSALMSPTELTLSMIKANNQKIHSLLEKSLEYAEKVKTANTYLKSLKTLVNKLLGDMKVREFELANVNLVDYCNSSGTLASDIQACLEANAFDEERSRGRNYRDYFKTALTICKQIPVNDETVLRTKHCTNAEAISEALTYFRRASEETKKSMGNPRIAEVVEYLGFHSHHKLLTEEGKLKLD